MNSKTTQYVIIGAIAFFVIIFFSNATFLTIDAGHKGVLFHRFGGGIKLEEKPYNPGFHVVAPWNTMFIYDVRFLEVSENMDVLSSNGLSIAIDVSLRYKPIDNKIGYLHNSIGQNYLSRIIIPEVRSATRKVVGKYTPEELYSTKREAIQTEIIAATDKVLSAKYLVLDALLIRSVQLPPTIKDAIERKLKQEQEAQEYEFKLIKEKKEAERKKIEAEGIRTYQMIINQSLTDKVLRKEGIEATKELAQSPNTKIVVIGSGKDGLPIILGGK